MQKIDIYKDNFLSIYQEFSYLFSVSFSVDKLDGILKRGYLKPIEDRELKLWFAQFISLMSRLWLIISDVEDYFCADTSNIKTNTDWRLFLIGYSSACLLITMDRKLIGEIAYSRLIKRKLNEPATELNIEAKTLHYIYKSLTSPKNAINLYYLRYFINNKKNYLKKLSSNDTDLTKILAILSNVEKSIKISVGRYALFRFNFLKRGLLRKLFSAKQKTVFRILEVSGRSLANLDFSKKKRVTQNIINEAKKILKPADIIISRHDFVASNYLLPGFWPHGAMYVGNEYEIKKMGVNLEKGIKDKWIGEIDTLEALKNGVKLKSIEQMLQVDNFIIIRPNITDVEKKEAIENILPHIGKSYNFDFDFFSSDKLVCTELIYRAFDGVGGIDFKLKSRAGRFTFSAEDLLDVAIKGEYLEAVAIFGVAGCKDKICTEKDKLLELIKGSYEHTEKD